MSAEPSKKQTLIEMMEQCRLLLLLLQQPVSQAELERVFLICSRQMPKLSRLSPDHVHKLLETMEKHGMAKFFPERSLWQLDATAAAADSIRTRLNDAAVAPLAHCIARALPAIGNRGTVEKEYLKRDIRNAYFAHDIKLLTASLNNFREHFPDAGEECEGLAFLLESPDWSDLASQPDPLLYLLAWQILPHATRQLLDIGDFERKLLEIHDDLPNIAVFPLIDYEILKGNWSKAIAIAKQKPNNNARMLRQAWLFCVFGKDDRAMPLFTDALYEVRQLEGTHDFYFKTVGGIFFIFSLLRLGDSTSLQIAESHAEIGKHSGTWSKVYAMLLHVIGHIRLKSIPDELHLAYGSNPLENFFCILCEYWLYSTLGENALNRLESLQDNARQNNFTWMAEECEELLNRCRQSNPIQRYHADDTNQIPFLIDCVQIRGSWLAKLGKINAFFNSLERRPAKRLAWQASLGDSNNSQQLTVTPLEQTCGKNARWSKGRKFTAFRNQNFCNPDHEAATFLDDYQISPQDKFACTILKEAMLQLEQNPDQAGTVWGHVFLALVGHARLYLDGPDCRLLNCLEAKPFIRITHHANTLHLTLEPLSNEQDTLVTGFEHGDTIKVYVFDRELQLIRAHLGKTMPLPLDGSEELRLLLRNLCHRCDVVSDYPLDISGLTGETADPRIYVRLLPQDQGMRILFQVNPFAPRDDFFAPGGGPLETIVHTLDGSHRRVRQVALELRQAELLLEACPILKLAVSPEPWTWLLSNPLDCYELTMQLRDALHLCVVQWPDDKRLNNIRTVSMSNLSLRTQNYKDWFSLEGEIKIDEKHTATLQELLRKVNDSKSRFILLDDGQVIALSENFRRRLDELNRLGEHTHESFRVHQFLQPVLGNILQEVKHLEHSRDWYTYTQRMEAALALEPEIPKTLKAELRHYQQEGFTWLFRLDALGAGACLADDMGLGKTLQAIALLLSKAAEGPSLVIAPTSVCSNWQREIARFAPALKVTVIGNNSTDRKEILNRMKAYGVLICSYGLLQSEIKMFEKIEWRIAVLDEAQAIKNYHAKRSQAALHINARFRLVTTGTPVENNLNELWTIFRFINPGLLGSREAFQRNFGIPIEREENKEASQHLNSLIKPFLLRRTKDQVLTELPPKTEIDLKIELSEEERNFYEALRREILTALESDEDRDGGMRMRVLSGIGKLRLATCHPSLAGGSHIPGSKLDAFLELLQEILQNGHKTLVFSQFVKFLDVVRTALDAQNICYQYLDGTMPTRDRDAAVEGFQRGDTSVFLISLRAGGLGLNLTQADYVIHLDSWWNPAVENQASDRAHRLGQTKPVTIYRLLTQNTIEEKVQELHQWKKNLASSLLEGNDSVEAITTDDLIRLLRESSEMMQA